MSLLDDVSIVVTPNGYKAGELYAVIPVPTEGAEEINNGDFATDLSGWDLQGTNATNTITWETNGARIISTGVNIGMAQTSVLTIGKTYRLTCDVAITVGKIGLDGATSGSTVNMVEGFNEIIFTAISTTFKIKRITGNDNCLLDNVSVKEYTSADMDVTRATDATRVDENGLIADVLSGVPRIDYTGGGCPHILAEPMRTNEIVNSDTSDFGVVRSARGVQETKLGIIEGYKYSYTSANPNINKNYSESTLGYKTLSVYFDATNSDYCQLNLASGGNGGTGANVLFTPSTQTFGSISENATYVRNSSANFESLGNNIYRIMLTTEFISYFGSTTFPIIYFGDNSNVWIGGVQVEQGSYATSYIPTSGSTVTRNQDIFTRDGIGSLINSTEGVLFVEMAALANDGTNKRISLSNGTNSYRIVISYSTSNNIQIFIVGAPAGTFAPSKSIDITLNSKIAVSWSSTEARFYVDGSPILVTLGNFSYTASTLSELKTEDGAGGSDFFGKVKQLQVYTTALTDTQLAALTS